jgi:hypothetical protein
VNLLLRMDAAQLAAADAVVAWIWNTLGVPRRMLLRMALVGQFTTQGAAEFIAEGRVELLTLLAGAVVMGLYHLNDMRWGANPELQRAFTLMRRQRPLARFVRIAVWILAAFDLWRAVGSPTLPLDVASTAFFMVFMLGGDALTPPGPPRKREPRRSPGFGKVQPVRP